MPSLRAAIPRRRHGLRPPTGRASRRALEVAGGDRPLDHGLASRRLAAAARAGAPRQGFSRAGSRGALRPDRCALRCHAGRRRARGGARACGAPSRSAAAGHEGSWRAVAHSPSRRRDVARAAAEAAKKDTRHYAKRQFTWFRHQLADWPRAAPDTAFEDVMRAVGPLRRRATRSARARPFAKGRPQAPRQPRSAPTRPAASHSQNRDGRRGCCHGSIAGRGSVPADLRGRGQRGAGQRERQRAGPRVTRPVDRCINRTPISQASRPIISIGSNVLVRDRSRKCTRRQRRASIDRSRCSRFQRRLPSRAIARSVEVAASAASPTVAIAPMVR